MRIAQWKVLFWALVLLFAVLMVSDCEQYRYNCTTDAECELEELRR